MQPGADQVVGRSVDGFACGFPVADAMDGRDAIVAVGMNGEPLPIEHGFPARLVVPGLYGYVSATKWLTEIELTTFADFDQYWLRRGWAQQAPIKLMSRIDTPRGLGNGAPPARLPIGGVAWAQHDRHRRRRGADRRRRRGCRPSSARPINGHVAPVDASAGRPPPGRHSITVRATDGDGAIQTTSAPNQSPTAPPGTTRSWSSSS